MLFVAVQIVSHFVQKLRSRYPEVLFVIERSVGGLSEGFFEDQSSH